jgi:hypothetical protein
MSRSYTSSALSNLNPAHTLTRYFLSLDSLQVHVSSLRFITSYVVSSTAIDVMLYRLYFSGAVYTICLYGPCDVTANSISGIVL